MGMKLGVVRRGRERERAGARAEGSAQGSLQVARQFPSWRSGSVCHLAAVRSTMNMGATMKCIRPTIALALALGLAGCTHTSYVIGERKFQDYEEARSYSDALENQLLAEIQPLPAPIAGPAIVIYPTRAQWEDDGRRNYPFASEQEIQDHVELGVGTHFVARVLERRNIFQSVRYIEAESPEGTQVPPGGYLLWYEMRDIGRVTGTDLHIIASGESERTRIVEVGESAGFEEGMHELQAIEEYVKVHPAAG